MGSALNQAFATCAVRHGVVMTLTMLAAASCAKKPGEESGVDATGSAASDNLDSRRVQEDVPFFA